MASQQMDYLASSFELYLSAENKSRKTTSI